MAGGFLPFQAPLVRAMRLPSLGDSDATRLSELAGECQEAAEAGNNNRLQTLKTEIDEIVYRLFDLAPEEVVLIEGSAPRT